MSDTHLKITYGDYSFYFVVSQGFEILQMIHEHIKLENEFARVFPVDAHKKWMRAAFILYT